MKCFPKVSLAMTGAAIAVLGTSRAGQAIVTPGDPAQYITPTDSFSGVAFLDLELDSGAGAACTGSLLPGGSYVLTAAHCVTDSKGVIDTSATTVDFSKQSTYNFKTSVTDYFISPGWDGNFDNGNDVAVLKLAERAPDGIQQYDINRVNNEVGRVFTAVGFGNSGTGYTGEVDSSYGIKRSGQNRFDTTVGANSNILASDFDNGNPANDLFGKVPGLNDTGLGTQEVNPASGDSGGPGLLDGKIAGILSYGGTISGSDSTDVNTILDSSFGEYSNYTRVSSYGSFIDDAISGGLGGGHPVPSSSTPVPEPSTNLGLVVFGAATIIAIGKRRRSESKVVQAPEN